MKLNIFKSRKNRSGEIKNTSDLISQLEELNPGVILEINDNGTDPYITVSCDPKELRLPEPFYFSDKNGITNKNKTATGVYICLSVVRR